MSKHIRTGLILALTMFVAFAYSPASFADKNGNSNSSNSDDKKDKKDKDDQNDQHRNRDRHQNDDQKSSNQQVQKLQQSGNDKQGGSKNTQQLIIGNGPQSGQVQKSQQFQNFQKQQWQNNQQQNNQQQNNQQQFNKNNWQNQSHKDHKELHNWVVQFGGPEPFSDKWYKDHPHAWHHDYHDHNDAWKVVTAAGVFGFLGWEVYHPHGVVIYEPVPYDTLFVSRPGVIIDPARGDWMPLGVFSLMVGPADASTRMLDLAIDRFGHIRGSYYDMISGASYNVAGIVDPRTQYAQWSLESNRQLTFFTPMGELMQPQGVVDVRLPSGQRQEWQLVRMESAN